MPAPTADPEVATILCCELQLSLRTIPRATGPQVDPPSGRAAVHTQLRSPRAGRRGPGGRGKPGLQRPRCRSTAPSGLLMGLAEPPCLRPGAAGWPGGGGPGARRATCTSGPASLGSLGVLVPRSPVAPDLT